MPRKGQSIELDKSLFYDRELADIIEKVIQIELNMGKRTYNLEKTRRSRQLKLNQMYTEIFSDKDMSIFEFSKIDELLRNSSLKHMIRIFNTIIYLLKNNIIHDDILARLLSFESHFTTHAKLYRDFTYLMRTSIYDIFVNDQSVMNSEYVIRIFFSVCEEQSLHDNEIITITNAWCETIKIDTTLTVSMRAAKLSAVHTLAKNLFSVKGIDELKLSDLLCTNHIALLMEYLEFIDARHQLSEEFHYLISFKDLLTGKGVNKYKIMCTSNNIFQFIGIKREHRKNCIYKTDVPYGTPLYKDIVEYITISRYRSTAFTRIIEHFYASMGNYAVTDARNLSVSTLKASSVFFSKEGKAANSILYSFYNLCFNKYRVNIFEKSGIDCALLEKHGIVQYIIDGYEIVKYNPYDDVPMADKWILYYNPKYDAATEHSSSKCIIMNFDDVQNKIFKAWIKEYVWHADKALHAKRLLANVLKEALNYIHKIRTREIIVIFCRNVVELDAPLTQSEIIAVRQYFMSQETTEQTQHSKIYNFRSFLQFLEDYDISEIPNGAYHHLYHQNEPDNTSVAIPSNELSLLTRVINTHAKFSLQEDLYSVIYAIALDTNLRISTIMSLDVECVVETAKNGEFVILLRTKDATTNKVQEPITRETKQMIDHAIEITDALRQQIPDNLRKRLFISPNNGSVKVRALTRNNFTIYLKKCCVEAEIPEYTASNLRDTHMTLAKAFQIKNKLSELELSVLTGHKVPNVDIEHYIDMDIMTMMEAVHGIVVGNVNLQGKIVKQIPADIARTENEVSQGCGYCQSECCTNFTYLDCIMCKDFVTMPSRLSFFEAQIKEVDVYISKAKTPHDKEDYVNIKRLLVAYESAIKSVEVTE